MDGEFILVPQKSFYVNSIFCGSKKMGVGTSHSCGPPSFFYTLYIFIEREHFGGPKRSVPKNKIKNISLGPIIKWAIIYIYHING